MSFEYTLHFIDSNRELFLTYYEYIAEKFVTKFTEKITAKY